MIETLLGGLHLFQDLSAVADGNVNAPQLHMSSGNSFACCLPMLPSLLLWSVLPCMCKSALGTYEDISARFWRAPLSLHAVFFCVVLSPANARCAGLCELVVLSFSSFCVIIDRKKNRRLAASWGGLYGERKHSKSYFQVLWGLPVIFSWA